jgi:anti-sigma factor (TIGR02949 family)
MKNMKSIPCSEVAKRLWAFIDGELDPTSEEEVREHLEMCQRCYPRYDFQRAYFGLMQRVAEAPLDMGDVRSRVFEALLLESGSSSD